ncbi:MAG: PEP-utilizing enzyme [Candidatus Diapherotrites archaeon]|nr:PEP-utilizing enzyme [Candidatus Diapherotrites archaeon]
MNSNYEQVVMVKQFFEKVYTRDYSVIMEEAWFHALTSGLKKKIGWKNSLIPNAYYVNDGTIEVWENKVAIQKLMDFVLGKNKDKNFLAQIIKNYKKHEKEIECFQKIKSVSVLKKFVEKVFEALAEFAVIYYSAFDERTPLAQRKIALEVRDKDSFFDNSDKIIRQSLFDLFPVIKGFEAQLMCNELGNLPELEELKKRKKNFVLIPGFFAENTLLEEFFSKHKEFVFALEQVKFTSEIKGRIAFAGKVSGKVRILKRKEQISEVREGEIIVSPMTTPEMLPVMKRASAIVTDEGGITCHAAIVARELKKPCIIGTKIATQLLTTGMLVEVDADNGIVRILKKV